MAALMAICYRDMATASLAMEEVERRSEDLSIPIDAVAVIIRDETGKFTTISNARAVADGAAHAMFWGLLFASLFFLPFLGMTVGTNLSALIEKVERMDITRIFETHVRELLKPGTSELFLVIDGAPDPVVAALSHFSGTVLESALSDEGHARLQEALHGRPSVVASTLGASGGTG
jgi:uncharacterized membrane protein